MILILCILVLEKSLTEWLRLMDLTFRVLGLLDLFLLEYI